MTADKVAFIGAGNMAKALIGGLMRAGCSRAQLVAADPIASQRGPIEDLGVATTDDNVRAIDGAGVVVLAVKPQVIGSVVGALSPHLVPGQLLLSIAAGVPIDAIQGWCGHATAIVRCMPNTPALYGAGISGLYANGHVTPRQRALAEQILAAAGEIVWVAEEGHLDAVTAVSGSGPAYFLFLMEALSESAVALGLPADLARKLTLATALGAAVMAKESGQGLSQLRRNVTSPGGTTERALSVLEQRRVREAFQEAISAAARRSRELAAEFGGTPIKQ